MQHISGRFVLRRRGETVLLAGPNVEKNKNDRDREPPARRNYRSIHVDVDFTGTASHCDETNEYRDGGTPAILYSLL